MLDKLMRRLRALFQKAQAEQDLEEELRFHLEKDVEHNIARGMSEAEARRAAQLKFGGVEKIKEECRDVRRVRWLEELWQDLRYSARVLVQNRGFTAAAVLTLALGIGANTAIFSVVNAVLLKPLPFKDPDRLVILWEKARQQDTSVSYPNFQDWREQNRSFEEITAFRRESFNLTGSGDAERLAGRMVSAAFFRTLGATLSKGIDFPFTEDRIGGQRVVILGHGFWQRRFGGDEGFIGKQLTLNDQGYTVIGITAPDFRFASDADVYVLLGQSDDPCSRSRSCYPGIFVVGRLKPSVSTEQARADMNGIMGRLAQQYPEANERRVHVESLYDDTVQDVRPALFILLGAVGFVLLMACANVANLLIARSAVRQKEIAIRTALGASRTRVVRQLLTESLVLALVGGSLGLVLAIWWADALKSLVPGRIPRLDEAGVDVRVLAFTAVASILTGVLFGLVPALQASRPDLNEGLKEAARGSTGSRHRVRSLLVVSQVAIALVLLIGAGLMVKSLRRLHSVSTGFEPQNLLTMQLSYTVRPGEPERARSFFAQLEEKIRATPGVDAVALSSGLPFLGAPENSVWIMGHRPTSPADMKMAVEYIVTPDYFRTLGIELKRGRLINEHDRAGGANVAVIDEAFAQKFFPGEEPIGKYLENGNGVQRIEVVGVVRHVKHYGLDGASPVDAQYYLPLRQIPDNTLPLVATEISLSVRTHGDPAALVPAISQQVRATDKNQPIFNARSMEEVIAESINARRFLMLLLTFFAAFALVLAGMGIYGVMSYTVAQRTREFGLRMALGAQKGDVLRLAVSHGLKLVLLGVAAGLAAALMLTRVMSSLLFGVSATDPATLATIPVVLVGVALLASYLPARRAAKVDPIIALRYE